MPPRRKAGATPSSEGTGTPETENKGLLGDSTGKQPHAICGAKTRSGRPCASGQMTNGRCRMHGGTSPGAPVGNQRTVKHGIFGKILGDDLVEEALALAAVDPARRAELHRLAREARVLRAASRADTPLAALDRAWSSVLADLDPDADNVGGESEDQGLILLDDKTEDWMDG